MINKIINFSYYLLFLSLAIFAIIGLNLSLLIVEENNFLTFFFKYTTFFFFAVFVYAVFPLTENIWRNRFSQKTGIILHSSLISILLGFMLGLSKISIGLKGENRFKNQFAQCDQTFSILTQNSFSQKIIQHFAHLLDGQLEYKIFLLEDDCRLMHIKKYFTKNIQNTQSFSLNADCLSNDNFNCFVQIIKDGHKVAPFTNHGLQFQYLIGEIVMAREQFEEKNLSSIVKKNITLGQYYLWCYNQFRENNFFEKFYPTTKNSNLNELTKSLNRKKGEIEQSEKKVAQTEMVNMKSKLTILLKENEKMIDVYTKNPSSDKKVSDELKKQLASLKFSLDNLI